MSNNIYNSKITPFAVSAPGGSATFIKRTVGVKDDPTPYAITFSYDVDLSKCTTNYTKFIFSIKNPKSKIEMVVKGGEQYQPINIANIGNKKYPLTGVTEIDIMLSVDGIDKGTPLINSIIIDKLTGDDGFNKIAAIQEVPPVQNQQISQNNQNQAPPPIQKIENLKSSRTAAPRMSLLMIMVLLLLFGAGGYIFFLKNKKPNRFGLRRR